MTRQEDTAPAQDIAPERDTAAAQQDTAGEQDIAAAQQDTAVRRGRRRRRLVLSAALVLAVAGGVSAYALTGSQSGAGGSVTVEQQGPGKGLPILAKGTPAPGFSLPRLGGGAPVSLAAERGHPVVLNFFASWCADCRAELKAFAAVSNGPHGSVRFLGIDTNDPQPGQASALLRAAGDEYPVGTDRSAAVANGRYDILALPVTVFVGASGRIVGQVFGAQTVSSLRPWIKALERTSGS